MPTPITASQFHSRHDLPDWRVVLGHAEARFRAGSFEEAAEFVRHVAAAAEGVDHHPDIDLRFPDRVHISMTTHDVGGLSDLDVALASAISLLASTSGCKAEPITSQAIELAIDVMDVDAVRPFWEAVLGYRQDAPDADGVVRGLLDPVHRGPAVWFQQMAEPRTQRNRIHIDVSVPHDAAERRVEAALAAGGRLVSDRRARAFWVLADPEGNEACVCTWQDRD